jgi:hypothetical protein
VISGALAIPLSEHLVLGWPVLRMQTAVPLWLPDELLLFGAENEDTEEDDPTEDEEDG